jgi:hypothetical protein
MGTQKGPRPKFDLAPLVPFLHFSNKFQDHLLMSSRQMYPKMIKAKIHGSQGRSSCARTISKIISAIVEMAAERKCLTRPPPALVRRS